MTHLQFVMASYAAAVLGFGGILAWLLADRHRQLSALRQLEKADEEASKRPQAGHLLSRDGMR